MEIHIRSMFNRGRTLTMKVHKTTTAKKMFKFLIENISSGGDGLCYVKGTNIISPPRSGQVKKLTFEDTMQELNIRSGDVFHNSMGLARHGGWKYKITLLSSRELYDVALRDSCDFTFGDLKSTMANTLKIPKEDQHFLYMPKGSPTHNTHQPITVPQQYAVANGLCGLLRNVVIHLSSIMRRYDDNIRSMFGTCVDYFLLQKTTLFKSSREYALRNLTEFKYSLPFFILNDSKEFANSFCIYDTDDCARESRVFFLQTPRDPRSPLFSSSSVVEGKKE